MEHRSSAEINDIIQKRREQFKGVRVMRTNNGIVTIEVKGGVPEAYKITDAVEVSDALAKAELRTSGLANLASTPVLTEDDARARCEWKTAE